MAFVISRLVLVDVGQTDVVSEVETEIAVFVSNSHRDGEVHLIEYLVKEVIMYDDKIQIIFKSPINTVPDEDRGFLIYEGIKQPKTIISRRWSTKRKILVEIRVE